MKMPNEPILVPTSPRDVVVNMGRTILWSIWSLKQLKSPPSAADVVLDVADPFDWFHD